MRRNIFAILIGIVIVALFTFTVLVIAIIEEKSRPGKRFIVRSNGTVYATYEILETGGGIKFINTRGDSIFIFGNYTIEKHDK